MKNLLATLLLSQGTPMMLAGDEFGRTQGGNNNAYCQDDEISWLNWDIKESGQDLIRFVQKLTKLRCKYPILRNRRFFSGEFQEDLGIRDIMWVTPAAQQVRPEDWADPGMHCFGMLIDGRAETRQNGDAAALLLIMNSHHENVPFTLPEAAFGSKWSLLVDTHRTGPEDPQEFKVCDVYDVAARSFLVFLLRTDSKS